jgi:UDPglucose 6-dehydrogenase
MTLSVYDPLYYCGSERLGHAFNCERSLEQVRFAKSSYDAVADAGCVVILTEWNEFRALDMKKIRELMNTSAIPLFMDFRNIYQAKDMTEFKYHRIGQKA